MKTCNDCKHAKWYKTASGKLHPSGGGECKYPYKVQPLPASMYWVQFDFVPSGGIINRRKDLTSHCVYWARTEPS